MKWLISMIALGVAIFLVYQQTAGITISLLDDCYSEAKLQLEPPTGPKRSYCSANRNVLEQMAVCLTAVQKRKFLAGLLYGVSGANSKITVMVDAHNEQCDSYSVPVPTADLYFPEQ